MYKEGLEKITKEDKMEIETPSRSIKSLIGEAGSNFVSLSFHRDNTIEEIRDIIQKMSLVYFKSLEDFTGKSKDELEKIEPGICEKYDTLIEKLKNPNLEHEEFIKIIDEGIKITNLK